jgi:tetratricopeptide (TPR) repeat protein
VEDGRVSRVTFRAGPAGVVARIAGGEPRLRAHVFHLESPYRVVVDVRSDDGASRPTPSPEPSLVDAGADSGDSGAGEDFQELLGWITDIEREVEALVRSDTEADRARHRRSLAFLLGERGLLGEAEKTLTRALGSDAHDPTTAYPDSVYLAELRLRLGDEDGAAEVARALPADRGTPREAVRLATVLSRCGLPDLARVYLEDALPRLTGLERVGARLLLARIHWERRDAAAALPLVAKLTESKHVPRKELTSALILQADCIWSLGRPSDAESYYRRALALSPAPEEASWVTLQLGNLAHRSGHIADAIEYYRRARDRWPDTFYGAQAEWFLEAARRTERLEGAEVVRNRG